MEDKELKCAKRLNLRLKYMKNKSRSTTLIIHRTDQIVQTSLGEIERKIRKRETE